MITATLCALMALATPAFGQDNAAIDQYREKTPSAGGDKPTPGDPGSTGGDSTTAPLPPGSTAALRANGSDGADTAKLAETTAPPPGGIEGPETGGSPEDSGDGLGALLWVLLAGGLLAAVALAVTLGRGGPDQPADG